MLTATSAQLTAWQTLPFEVQYPKLALVGYVSPLVHSPTHTLPPDPAQERATSRLGHRQVPSVTASSNISRKMSLSPELAGKEYVAEFTIC